MSYNDIPCADPSAGRNACNEKKAMPDQALAEILHETCALADDVLNMTHIINNYLFCDCSTGADRPEESRCFRDELLKTRYELCAAVKELAEITTKLGI